MNQLVEIRDLAVGFPDKGGRLGVVRDVSFTIGDGEIVGVVGESGSGKSMTALALMGLLPKEAAILGGQILFEGRDLLILSGEEMRNIQGNDISFVFQEPMTSLNPVMKIGRQVGESLRLHTSLGEREIRERVIGALEGVGLAEAESLCEKYPHELSGGMRQRVMIAQAMIASPKLLIADEPTTALDVVVQAQILKLLKKINQEQHTAVLFISHDLNVVKELCSRVIVMYRGEIVEHGAVDQVLNHPQHAYTRKLVASIPENPDAAGGGTVALRLDHLNVYYDIRPAAFWKPKTKKHVIQDVSLTAYDGELLGIVGESGCGKSTLCKAILGMNSNYTGTIEMASEVRPQMVFQDPYGSLNPARKIGWILEEPLKLRGIADRRERRSRANAMLCDVGLDPSFADRYPRELSGGQRQRISIGAALLMDSHLLIADEPVSALDVTVQSQILNLLLKVHREKRMTMLFITHDLNIVHRICKRVAVLYLGEIVEMGDVEKVYRSPAHPYTRLLLDSVTEGKAEPEKMRPESGGRAEEEPCVFSNGEGSPRDFPGCPFFPRCPRRLPQCKVRRPDRVELAQGHSVKCFLAGECVREGAKERRGIWLETGETAEEGEEK